jgi:hypothetical protein
MSSLGMIQVYNLSKSFSIIKTQFIQFSNTKQMKWKNDNITLYLVNP